MRKLAVSLVIGMGILAIPMDCRAVIVHGPPEGFYTHQIAHMLFLLAMVYVWWQTRQRSGNAWKYIRLSFLLFALWNLDALIVHWLDTLVTMDQFAKSGQYWSLQLRATQFYHFLLFFGKLDHFLCVPAAASLYYGLRLLRLQNKGDPLDSQT